MRSLDAYLIEQLRRLLGVAESILLAVIAIRFERWSRTWRWRSRSQTRVEAPVVEQVPVVGEMPFAGRSRYQRHLGSGLMPSRLPFVLGRSTLG